MSCRREGATLKEGKWGLRTRYVLSFFAHMFEITASYKRSMLCKLTINVKEWARSSLECIRRVRWSSPSFFGLLILTNMPSKDGHVGNSRLSSRVMLRV